MVLNFQKQAELISRVVRLTVFVIEPEIKRFVRKQPTIKGQHDLRRLGTVLTIIWRLNQQIVCGMT